MNYPTINAKELPKLVKIVEQAADDPEYLDPAKCPYDEKTIALIRKLVDPTGIAGATTRMGEVRPERGKVGRPSKGPAISVEEVEREVNEIRQELASLKVEGQQMETSDRIQVIKTRAALIERVIGMKERVADIKRFHSFVTTVIGIMEEHLEPKDRDKVLEELKVYVEI
jgi:hypothetical protein